MKILVVTQYFFPENFRINDLVVGLTERGHEVTVLTGQPNYPDGKFAPGFGWLGPRREEIFKAKVLRVPLVARGNGGKLRLFFNYLSFAFLASIAVLFRVKGPFDVIFVFEISPVTVGFPALVARKKFGAPILFWVLDLWPDSLRAVNALQSPFWLRLLDCMVSWIYAHCARVLVSSKGFCEDIVKHGKTPGEVLYFPNWIEPEYMNQSELVHTRVKDNVFRIIYAGNIGAAQGFGEVLECMKMAAHAQLQVHWVIAGNGRMLEWLTQKVRDCGLSQNVVFLGQLASQKMPELFASADALLVSLKSDPVFNSIVPGKVQSYLAAGRPIVGMLDGEGAKMLEEAKAGFVGPAGEPAMLLQNIEKLIRLSEKEREQLGSNGRLYALRHFERESLFDRLVDWMHEVVRQERGAL